MFSMIYKDILLARKMFLVSLIWVLFAIFAVSKTGWQYLGVCVAIPYLFIMRACAYDEKNRAERMLNSLPISRSQIVFAKYLAIFIYLAYSIILYALVRTVLITAGVPIPIAPVRLTETIIAIFTLGIMNAIYYPLFFKLGYIKSNYVNLFMFFSFFFGPGLVVQFTKKHVNTAWLGNLINFAQTSSPAELELWTLIITLIILLCSYMVSVKIYKKREF